VVIIVFWLQVSPSLHISRSLVAEYAQALAATSPDFATAQDLAKRLDLRIRYEGPGGAWTTSDDLPSIAEVRSWPMRGNFYLASRPDGGTYLVAWTLGPRLMEAHDRFLWQLLLFVAGVGTTAYFVLRRILRPLRPLYAGVARLSEGHLDVVVPSWTRDELGLLTDAFNQMVRRIREMLRARDQLLLDVSHELRSPLTRVKVALALLPEGDKTRRIATDVAEMEMMITELLELERLREGHGIRTERQDLVPILREVVERFQDRPSGVCLTSAAPEIPLEIFLDMDGDRVRIVLRNLLENAIKYSLPDSGPVEVSVAETDETVAIHVTDDGPGIPEADLGSLFEPFFRVDRSRSKKSGGYGLGLSICKRILEAHGGRIAAENNSARGAGRGARFTLTFVRGPRA
jgi:signal transduction histidine kinase